VNDIHYLVITYKGKKSEKEYIYTYTKLNHFAVHLKLTPHCKSTILQFKENNGNFLVVQWLGLSTFTARAQGSIPGGRTKIPPATRCGPSHHHPPKKT